MIGTSIFTLIRSANNPPNEEQLRQLRELVKSAPEQVHSPDTYGRRPCHLAALCNQDKILEILVLEGKASLLVRDSEQKTPYHLASKDNTRQTIRGLLFETDYERQALSNGGSFLSRLMAGMRISHSRPKEIYPKNQWWRGETVSRTSSSNRVSSSFIEREPTSDPRVQKEHSAVETANSTNGNLTKDSLSKIIRTDDWPVFNQYLNRTPHAITGKVHGRPYLLQAFVEGAEKIFFELVLKGADIRAVSKHGHSFQDYLGEGNNIRQDRLQFLQLMHARLIEYLSINGYEKSILGSKKRLQEQEEEFEMLLLEKGLGECDNKLWHEILIGLGLPLKEKKWEVPSQPAQWRNILFGLLGEHGAEAVWHMLLLIYSRLPKEQKLISLYLIKEMLCGDEFTYSYLPQNCSLYFKKLSELSSTEGLGDLLQQLLMIRDLKERIKHPAVEAVIVIDGLLARYGVNAEIRSAAQLIMCRDPRMLAQELRAISLQFYHQVKITEFVGQAWKTEHAARHAPTILYQLELFSTKLANFFLIEILNKTTEKERLAVISLYISALHELLQGDIPDFNSAMVLSSVLEHRYIEKIVDLSALDGKAKESLENARELLSVGSNYKKMRAKLRSVPICIPFLGLILRDLVGGAENTDIQKLTVLGEVYGRILQTKTSLAEIFIPYQTNLLAEMHRWQAVTPESLELLVMRHVPLIVHLSAHTIPIQVKNILEVYGETGFPLKVLYLTETKDGNDAIHLIGKWIKDLVGEGILKSEQEKELYEALRIYSLKKREPIMSPPVQTPSLLWQRSFRISRMPSSEGANAGSSIICNAVPGQNGERKANGIKGGGFPNPTNNRPK